MGLKDRLKQTAEEARASLVKSVHAGKESRATGRDRAETDAAATAERQRLADEQRHQRFEAIKQVCPLRIQEARARLPGGLELLEDEYLVTVGRDWGWSSTVLTLTTHRAISTHGQARRDQSVMYLTDVVDVHFHKPRMGHGTLSIETAGSRIEGLPAAKNGAKIRNDLMAPIHFAREQAKKAHHAPIAASAAEPAPIEEIPAKIKQLADLRDDGHISPEEFEAKKAELLSRM